MLKIYTYSGCDTCRRAVKWLRAHDREFAEVAIRQTPPTVPELRRMLAAYAGNARKLFNVAGGDYRDLGLKDRLPGLSEADQLALLAGNGNLVKRPFLLGPAVALVGFDESAWAQALLTAGEA